MTRGDTSTDERMAAMFVAGFLAFNPPLLWAFDGDGLVFGIPILYVSLFAAWGALIVAMALATESYCRTHPDTLAEPASPLPPPYPPPDRPDA